MNAIERLDGARALLAGLGKEAKTNDSDRIDYAVERERLLEAASALKQAGWTYLSAITGLDLGTEAGAFEVLYSFCGGAAVVTLRVRVPRDGAHVPSLRSLLPYVVLYERELAEMFGIAVDGDPEPGHVYLAEDWPVESYPLRKDWQPAETGQGNK